MNRGVKKNAPINVKVLTLERLRTKPLSFLNEIRRLTLFLSEGLTLQTKERRALPMYVTYSDLIQVGIFIVALVGLCYTVFKANFSTLNLTHRKYILLH